MVKRAAVLVSLLFLAATLRAQQTRPAVAVNGGGAVMITLPESILRDARVRKQLDTALTTTFLLTAKPRGGGNAGAARLEIRYDLWDEVYHVKRIALDRRVEQLRITAAQLEQWWRTPLRVALGGVDRMIVDLELSVLPFSAAEERDARDWLSKSGGVGAPDTRTNSVVDVLIGTTITARPIVSYRWTEVAAKR